MSNWTKYKCECGHKRCNQYTISIQGSVGFDEEDANLICAAPELLEALEGMCKAYKALADMTNQGDYISDCSRYAHAQVVIKKARGES